MNEVKVVYAVAQNTVRAHAERERLTESSFEKQSGFNEIWPCVQFPICGKSARVVVVENIKARQFVHFDAWIKNRVGLTTENLDMMPKVNQGFCQVARVDTLTTNMRLAAICEIRNSYRTVDIKRFSHQKILSA